MARVLDFDRVTGSAGSIPILKKFQNDVILVKKKNKSQRDATEFLTGFYQVNLPGRLGYDFFYFFINQTRFQPRLNPPDRTGFQNYT